MQTETRKKTKEKKSFARNVLEWVCTLLAALVFALVIRSFVFEFVKVDGASMERTLTDGEIMLVTKFDYSSTWLSLPWQDPEGQEQARRITFGGNPQRFDVVICRYPGRGAQNFVKRVIGLPGDTVEIRDGILLVNGDRYEEPYVDDAFRVPGGSNGYAFGPYTVPDGEYFVMGDHRNNSNDSRAQGSISRDMIVGHVRSVISLSGIRGIE